VTQVLGGQRDRSRSFWRREPGRHCGQGRHRFGREELRKNPFPFEQERTAGREKGAAQGNHGVGKTAGGGVNHESHELDEWGLGTESRSVGGVSDADDAQLPQRRKAGNPESRSETAPTKFLCQADAWGKVSKALDGRSEIAEWGFGQAVATDLYRRSAGTWHGGELNRVLGPQLGTA
jgi:hypothetical protein